ncbi:MAG: small multi-drug export protein [Oscillospiraceae bacterium]|nr:small multi-drug export protein [Oscillospiraceae bacterium]MBR6208709.1 small multi-drug export protein [Oscillospiraceae bacterium]
MIPVAELRGAIPFGVARGVGLWSAIIAAILGNLLPTPFIILFIRRLFAWLRVKSQWLNSLVSRLEARAAGKEETVRRYAFWGLVILVAIPLPGTGAWTGSLVAAMMDIPLKKSLPAITVGVVIAAIVVSVITYGVTVVF